MARLKFGSFIVEGSGSLGGHTIQNSTGGIQFRTKPINKKRPSEAQSIIRSINSILQYAWRSLTEVQRSTWNNYVISAGIRSRANKNVFLSGHSYFMSYNYYFVANGYPAQLYPALPKSLLAWYRFDVDSKDYSSNGFDGTCVNTSFDPFGAIKSAIKFNGINSYCSALPASYFSTSNDFTVAAWVNRTASGYALGCASVSSPFSSNWFFVYSSLNFLFWFRSRTLGDLSLLPNGVWGHLCMVFDKTSKKFEGFLNGVSLGVSLAITPAPAAGNVIFGCRPDLTSTFFDGSVDSATFFNRKLTAAEVSLLHLGYFPQH